MSSSWLTSGGRSRQAQSARCAIEDAKTKWLRKHTQALLDDPSDKDMLQLQSLPILGPC